MTGYYREGSLIPYAMEVNIPILQKYTSSLFHHFKSTKTLKLDDVKRIISNATQRMAIELGIKEQGIPYKEDDIREIEEQYFVFLSKPHNKADKIAFLTDAFANQFPDIGHLAEAAALSAVDAYGRQAGFIAARFTSGEDDESIRQDIKYNAGYNTILYASIAMQIFPMLSQIIPQDFDSTLEWELRDSADKYKEWETFTNSALELTNESRISISALSRKVMADSGVITSKQFMVIPQEWFPVGIEAKFSGISPGVFLTRGQRGQHHYAGRPLEMGMCVMQMPDDGGFEKHLQIPTLKLDNEVYATLIETGMYAAIADELSWSCTEGGHDDRHNVMTARTHRDNPSGKIGKPLERYEDMGLVVHPSGNIANEHFAAVSRFLSRQHHYQYHPDDKQADIERGVAFVDLVKQFIDRAKANPNHNIQLASEDFGFYLLCSFIRNMSGMWDLDDPDLEPFRKAVDSLGLTQTIPATDIRPVLRRYLAGQTEKNLSIYENKGEAPDSMRIEMAGALLPVFERLNILPEEFDGTIPQKTPPPRKLLDLIKRLPDQEVSGFQAARLAVLTQTNAFYELSARYHNIYTVVRRETGDQLSIQGEYFTAPELTKYFHELYNAAEPSLQRNWQQMIQLGKAAAHNYDVRSV